MLKAFGSRTRFLRATGDTVPATVTKDPVTNENESFTYMFRVAPTTDLMMDQWYWLWVDAGADPLVQDPVGSARTNVPNAPVQVAFFTGSAPELDWISRKSGSAGVLQMFFSEPVQIATLAGGMLVTADGKTAIGCPSYMGQCVKSDTPIVNLTTICGATQSEKPSLW